VSARGALPLLIGATLCWSTGGVLIKIIDLPGPALAGWRSLIAALALLVLRRGARLPWPLSGWTLAGAACFALNTLCFVSATKLTTAANAILLQYTAPIYVLLGAGLLLGERVSRRDILAVGIALAGIALLLGDRLGGGSLPGDGLALLAGLSFAGTILCLRRTAATDPLAIPLLGCGLAALLLAPLWIGSPPPAGQWPWLLALGAGQFGLGYALYAAGVRRTTAALAVLAAALEPVLNPVWVFLVLGEHPGPAGLAGGALVIASVLGRAWFRERGPAAP
jgi:drug/metabolite transporter (DMT)-like permease